MISQGSIQFIDKILRIVEAPAIAVDQCLSQQPHGQPRLTGPGRADKDDILCALDEAEVTQCIDLVGVDTGLLYRVKQRLDYRPSCPVSVVFSSLSNSRIRCCRVESLLLLDSGVARASACSSSSAKAAGR